jgi:photosystem II stability/assembly factor-like uncharacterized protein
MDIVDCTELVNIGPDNATTSSWASTIAFPFVNQYYNIASSFNGRFVATVGTNDYIYVSSDGTTTCAPRASIRSWLSICMSNSGKHLAATASGDTIYISSDWGATWASKGTAQSWSGQNTNIAMSGDGRYIMAPTQSGYVYRSADYGQSWSTVNGSGLDAGVCGIAMSASGRYVAYATAGMDNGIYLSSDYGMTYTLCLTMANPFGLAMSASGQYISAARYGGNIYVSGDYGVTFTQKSSFGGSTPYWWSLSMSGSGQVQVGCSSGSPSPNYIYRSLDYGNTWAIWNSTNTSWYGVSMTRSGNRAYACARGGSVWRINQEVLQWNNLTPFLDNSFYLGNSARRWAALYAANGTIQTSDSALKDAVPLPYGLNELVQVRTIKYKWKSQADLAEDDPLKSFEYYGFCADELAPLFPELVYNEDKDSPVQMNYAEMLPVVVNAVKEMKGQLDVVRGDHASLQADHASLKADYASLQADYASLKADHASLKARVSAIADWLRNTQGIVLP